MAEWSPAVVIDNGSGLLKAGFAAESAPRAVFPTIVGKPRMPLVMLGTDNTESYVGYEAILKCGVLTMKNAVERGTVVDWEDLEKIWHHTFYSELRVEPDQHPCLMTEAPLNPKLNREKMLQIAFETFNIPGFYLSMAPALAVYSTARSTGLVVDSGHGVTSIVPVYEGNPLHYAIQRINLASTDLTDYLITILMERGYYLHGASAREIVNDVKEKMAFVAGNYAQAMREDTAKIEEKYLMPDGNVITLGTERFRCPELLFQPSFIGKEMSGIHELAQSSLNKLDPRLHASFYSSIILSGGSTLFPGLQERLTTEMAAHSTSEVKVIAQSDRNLAAWVGGSVLSALSGFKTLWITRADYDETGPAVVYSKCY